MGVNNALTEAVSLCHSDEGVLALHAFALHEAPDADHGSLFAQVLERQLGSLLAELPEPDRQAFVDYVLAADPDAALPKPQWLLQPSSKARYINSLSRVAYCRIVFLAAKHDPAARCALRLLLALIPGSVVHSVYYGNLQHKFIEGMPMLRDLIPGGGTTLLLVMAFVGVATCLIFRRDRHILALEKEKS